MRIIKIIHGYPPFYNAGSEVYSQSICNELSINNELFIFTREENPYEPDYSIRKEIREHNQTFYFVNMPRAKDGYRHTAIDSAFEKIIKEVNPSIAHVGHLNHLSTGLVHVLKSQKIPIVFTLHDFWLMCPRGQFLQRNFGSEKTFQLCTGQENKKCATNCYNAYNSGIDNSQEQEQNYWEEWINQRMKETKEVAELVDLFIAPSKYLLNRFIDDFKMPKDKIIYLDYGFPIHYLTPKEVKSNSTIFTFGYIGTHIPSKGINLLIEAFGSLKNDNIKLKIWGAKDQQSSKALNILADKSCSEVEFMGEYINKNLADEVFSNVDCIVVPSIWAENSPLVIHEAQACKIPVITSNFGGMSEYVNHKTNGLLFEHRDIDSLKEQMQWAIDNPNELKALGLKGYLFSQDGQVPSIKNHCEQLVSIYNSLISKSKLWRITIDTNPEDCNLNCIMCEEHSEHSTYIDELFKETGKRKRRMPVEWLDKIVKQAKELNVKEIIPSTMGEPLIYKAIEKIYDLASENNIQINLTTNGTFPRKSVKEWAEIIIPNTSDVKISWNGATKETSEKVMKGVDFEKVLSNTKEFIEYRDDYFKRNGKYCWITLQLTFMQNNMHELKDIIELAAKLNVDRVKGHHLWAHFSEIADLSMKQDHNSITAWNVYVKEAHEAANKYLRPNGKKVVLENIVPLVISEKKEVPLNYNCPFLEKELWISATGKISPCCAPDKQRDTLGDFGNIQHKTIDEVLRSNQYVDLVKNYKQHTLCKTCNMRKPNEKETAIS